MLNQIIIMGRLTRDPELRRTQSGTAVCSFSVAVDRDFKSQSGEKETDFIDVVAWRQTGEFVSKYFTKGRMIVVSGSLQSRKWQDRNGQNRISWEVIADNVYFGDSKRDSAGDMGGSYAAPAYTAPAGGYSAPVGGGPSGFAEIDEEDGDLPAAPASVARRFASSAWTSASASITRTLPSCAASFPSAPRSCPAAPPAPAPCTSVS